ncbi:hypothetical protein QEN19_001785 [Hanseniaspora menglaensis]
MKQRTLMSFFKTKKTPELVTTAENTIDTKSNTKVTSTVLINEKLQEEIDFNSSVNNSTTVTPHIASDKEEIGSLIANKNIKTSEEESENEDDFDSFRGKRSTRNKKVIIESDDESDDAKKKSTDNDEDNYVPDDDAENTFTTANSSLVSTSKKRKLTLGNRTTKHNNFPNATQKKAKSSIEPKKVMANEFIIPDKYSFLKTYKKGEKTVHIPQSSFSKFTDFEKQYWNIKKDLMDVVLLFKKGKFYEVYENDALLANKKFDWKIAGQSNSGSFANSPQNSQGRAGMVMGGIPEMSLDYWINQFVSNGYKVGKVEQLESLLLKTMQNNNGKKVVERELECIFSKGSMDNIDDSGDSFIISLKEIFDTETDIAFEAHIVDLSVNKFYFQKMLGYQELETFFHQVTPKEIVINEIEGLCDKTTKLIKFHNPNLQCEDTRPC